jgi:hypothetical protein
VTVKKNTNSFWVPNDKLSDGLSFTPRSPKAGWGKGFIEYEPYEGNEDLFKRDQPLDFTCPATWWLLGYCVDRATLTFHTPITKAEAALLGLKCSRGATKHVAFANPEFPKLDVGVKVFFDPWTGGINSKPWFDFLSDGCGGIRQITPPVEFKYAFEAGRRG